LEEFHSLADSAKRLTEAAIFKYHRYHWAEDKIRVAKWLFAAGFPSVAHFAFFPNEFQLPG
jgi:hypothetical protein